MPSSQSTETIPYRRIAPMWMHIKKMVIVKRLSPIFTKIKKALEQESRETKEMLKIYMKYSRSEATEEEMAQANKQFRDFLKTVGLGVLTILPFAIVTIPLMVKWGKKIGIDIIPESFKE